MTPNAPPPRNAFQAFWQRIRRACVSAGARIAGSWRLVPSPVRRFVVFVIGSTVLLIGVIMLVTPGPAFVVIPVGLAILAIEFVWARRLLHRVRQHIDNTVNQVAKRNRSGWFRRWRQPTQQPQRGDSQ